MKGSMTEIKQSFLRKKGFYDKVYLTEEECNIIDKMPSKKRKAYAKEHGIFNEPLDSTSYGRYHQCKYWEITDEELVFLTTLDNNMLLSKIRDSIGFIVAIMVMGILISLFAGVISISL